MTSTALPRHPRRTVSALRRAISAIRQVNAELMLMSEILLRPPGAPRPRRQAGPRRTPPRRGKPAAPWQDRRSCASADESTTQPGALLP
jgi:hypothetical protein